MVPAKEEKELSGGHIVVTKTTYFAPISKKYSNYGLRVCGFLPKIPKPDLH